MPLHELSRALGTPLHHQVAALLRDGMAAGRHVPGDRLPGEEALARQYGVSRVTVRRALHSLHEQGLIVRRQGQGTFVAQGPAVAALSRPMAGYQRHVAEARRRSRPSVLEHGQLVAPPEVRAALGLAAGEAVLRVRRLRRQGRVPVMLSTVHLPLDVAAPFARADFARRALTELMEGAGRRYARFDFVAGATLADAATALLLGVPVGSALTHVRRVAYDAAGRAIEHQLIVAPPQRWQLHVEVAG